MAVLLLVRKAMRHLEPGGALSKLTVRLWWGTDNLYDDNNRTHPCERKII